MKRNPVNIFNDYANKAAELIECAMRASIHSKRARMFNEIDLRHYKSNQKKKDRIRHIIMIENVKSIRFIQQGIIIGSQPVYKSTFEKGYTAQLNTR